MVDTQMNFNKRLNMLTRKHAAMSNGFATEVRNDGLIVIKPRRPASGRLSQTRRFLVIVVGFFVFKALVFAALGDITYNERVAKLGNGTMLEQVGAWAMQADGATLFISGFLEPLISE